MQISHVVRTRGQTLKSEYSEISAQTSHLRAKLWNNDFTVISCSIEFCLSVESKLRLLWFCITMLSDWLKNLAPLSQPIRSKTKTNRDLLAQVFPRFV